MKNKKGITLIALVITVIVLLIFAGISVNMITGQDGVLSKVERTTVKHNEAAIKEACTAISSEAINDYFVNGQKDVRSSMTERITVENLSQYGVKSVVWEETSNNRGVRAFEITTKNDGKINGYVKPDGTLYWGDANYKNLYGSDNQKFDLEQKISEEIKKNNDIDYLKNNVGKSFLAKQYGYSEDENFGVKDITWKEKMGTKTVKITYSDDSVQNGYISENSEMVWEEFQVNFELKYTDKTVTEVDLYPGKYLLQVWGGQGAKSPHGTQGGKGGYSEGKITIDKKTKIYVVVGEAGERILGGYNGGGTGSETNQDAAAGGGATHMAFKTGLLSELSNDKDKVIIVAGGGGGSGCTGTYGGAGGGTEGLDGTGTDYAPGKGGTQTSGGANGGNAYDGTFGKGGDAAKKYAWPGAGGGGGWYGGGSGANLDGGGGAGGGGSGYINTRLLTDAKTLNGNSSDVPQLPDSVTSIDGAKNGHAKITYIEE